MTTTSRELSVVQPADHVPGPKQGAWTYDDYAQIPEDGTRYEVIDGVLYMAPSPGSAHQIAVGNITAYLKLHVEFKGRGTVFVAPFDVELGSRAGVVQPDVLVVLNEHRNIITPSRVIGAPDLVIEVVSPSTATHDRRSKMDAYAQAGVPEYWIADPFARTVELLYLEGDQYRTVAAFQNDAVLPSRIVPDFPVTVEQFFGT